MKSKDCFHEPNFRAQLRINDRINFKEFEIQTFLNNSGYDLKNEIEIEGKNLSADNIRLVSSGHLINDYFSLYYQGIKNGSVIFIISKKVSNSRITPSMQVMRLTELIERYFSLSNGKISNYSISQIRTPPKQKTNSIQLNDLRSIINEISEIVTNPMVKASARIYPEFQLKIEEAYEIIQSSNALQNGLFGNNIYFSSLSQKSVLFAARTHDIAFDQVESTPEGFRLLQTIVKEIDQNNGSDVNNSSFFASSLHPVSVSSSSSWYGKGKQKVDFNYKSEISTKPLPQCWCRPSSLASASPAYFMGARTPIFISRNAMANNNKSMSISNRPNNFFLNQSKFEGEYGLTNFNPGRKVSKEIKVEQIQSRESPPRNVSSSVTSLAADNTNAGKKEEKVSNNDICLSKSKISSKFNGNIEAMHSTNSPSIFGIPIPVSSVSSSRSQKDISSKGGQSDDIDFVETATDDDDRNDVKEKFAMQLDTLKSMGFNDEGTILRALTEADGNVQLALRILKKNPLSSVK